MSIDEKSAPGTATTGRNGLGVAGMVIGLVALLLGWLLPLIGYVLVAVGLTLSVVGLQRARRGEATNRGQATAGIWLNAGALVLCIISSVIGAVILSGQV